MDILFIALSSAGFAGLVIFGIAGLLLLGIGFNMLDEKLQKATTKELDSHSDY